MALLEGFESLSGSPALPTDLSWSGGGFPGLTESGSSSNVTEGAQSYRVSGTSSYSDDWSIGTYPTSYDITGATSVDVDITISAIGSSAYLELNIFNPSTKQTATDVTGFGETGTFTLSADVSGFSSLTTCLFTLKIVSISSSDAFNIFWDNLRDDAGGGASVGSGLITGLKLNRMSLV